MIRFQLCLRRYNHCRKSFLNTQELINDSARKILQPRSEINLLCNVIVIASDTDGFKITRDILVIVIFKTEQVKSIQSHICQQDFSNEACRPSIAIHERMNNNHLLVEKPSQN